MPRAVVVLTGRIVGVLTVLERGPNLDDGKLQWWCSCSNCDEEVLITGENLKRFAYRFDKECYLCKDKIEDNK